MSITLTGAGRAPGGSAPVPPAGATFAAIPHPAYCASDASHLVPCAPGDSVRWIQEAVSGTWHEQATSGSRMILRANGSGYYFEGAPGRRHLFAGAGLAAARSIGTAAAGTTTQQFHGILSDTSAAQIWLLNESGSWYNSAGNLSTTTEADGVTTRTVTGGNVWTSYIGYRATDTSLTNGVCVGTDRNNAGSCWFGGIAGVVLMPLSDATTLATLRTWLRSLYP